MAAPLRASAGLPRGRTTTQRLRPLCGRRGRAARPPGRLPAARSLLVPNRRSPSTGRKEAHPAISRDQLFPTPWLRRRADRPYGFGQGPAVLWRTSHVRRRDPGASQGVRPTRDPAANDGPGRTRTRSGAGMPTDPTRAARSGPLPRDRVAARHVPTTAGDTEVGVDPTRRSALVAAALLPEGLRRVDEDIGATQPAPIREVAIPRRAAAFTPDRDRLTPPVTGEVLLLPAPRAPRQGHGATLAEAPQT